MNGKHQHTARFGAYQITSSFQPIVSFSYGRTIGHEGLMRGVDPAGQSVSPLRLIAQADVAGTLVEIDRTARQLHLANYAGMNLSDGWLFLNMHPQSFSSLQDEPIGRNEDTASGHSTLLPNRIVIEILEDAVKDDIQFDDGVAIIRRRGWGIALDDFGAGHSNFDRVWRIKPDIVKLDASYAHRSTADPAARRMLPSIVALLHEAGSLVLLEGIETAEQAMIAMDADIDFGQGFYFARPAPADITMQCDVEPLLKQLWPGFDLMRHSRQHSYSENMMPYLGALGLCSARLEAGVSPDDALVDFLGLENSERCFLLNSEGYQVGPNYLSRTFTRPAALAAFQNASNARWSRRPYFHRAINHMGTVQITRPYRSIATSQLCVTVSIGLLIDGETHVLCGDVLWNDLP